MKVFYSIEIQMCAGHEVTDDLMEVASYAFQFLKKDVDEKELYRVTALFSNEIKPTEMRERARRFLHLHKDVYYVDVIYRFEHEMVPDRFVRWQNGDIQEYTGHVEFREENAE